MNVTILGSDGAYPSPNGACSGYLVRHDDDALLLDAGSGVAPRLLNEIGIAKLDGIALSHLHYDHCSDALALSYAIQFAMLSGEMNAPMPLLIPREPEPVATLFERNPNYTVRHLTENSVARVGLWRVSCVRTNHPIMTYALRVTHINAEGQSIVYTGDTNIHAPLVGFAANASLLIADACESAKDWSPQSAHMTAADAAGLAMCAKVSRLIITHLKPGTDAESCLDEARLVFKRVLAASAFTTYECAGVR